MRKSLMIILSLMAMLLVDGKSFTESKHTEFNKLESIEDYMTKLEDSLRKRRLVMSIMYHESRFNDSIVNETSGASGCLQIMKSMVRHINATEGTNYTYSDRFDRKKSEEMFFLIMDKYNPTYDLDTAAHVWYCGPYKMKSRWNLSRSYRREISDIYNIIKLYDTMNNLENLPPEIKAERVLKDLLSQVLDVEVFNVIYYKGRDKYTNAPSDILSISFKSSDDLSKYNEYITTSSLCDDSGVKFTDNSVIYSGSNLISLVSDMILEKYNQKFKV